MREKYVEERFPRWFKWGQYRMAKDDGGHVWAWDINDGSKDVLVRVPEGIADKLIEARDAYVNSLIAIFSEHPEAFFGVEVDKS